MLSKFLSASVFLVHLLLVVQSAPLGRRHAQVALSMAGEQNERNRSPDTVACGDAFKVIQMTPAVTASHLNDLDDINYIERRGKDTNGRAGPSRLIPYRRNAPKEHPHLEAINAQRAMYGTTPKEQRALKSREIVHSWQHPEGHIAYATKGVRDDKIWGEKGHLFEKAGYKSAEDLMHHVEKAHTEGTPQALQAVHIHDPITKGHRTIWSYYDHEGTERHLAIQTDATGGLKGVNVSTHSQVETHKQHMADQGWSMHPTTGAPTREAANAPPGGSLLSRIAPAPGPSSGNSLRSRITR